MNFSAVIDAILWALAKSSASIYKTALTFFYVLFIYFFFPTFAVLYFLFKFTVAILVVIWTSIWLILCLSGVFKALTNNTRDGCKVQASWSLGGGEHSRSQIICNILSGGCSIWVVQDIFMSLCVRWCCSCTYINHERL